MLAHYDHKLLVEISVDASPYGLGAVIMHVYPNGNRRPIAYASRTLKKHWKRNGQIDKDWSFGDYVRPKTVSLVP